MKLNRKKVTGIIATAAAAACVIFGAARQGMRVQPDSDNDTAAALTDAEQEYLDSLATGRTAKEAFTETLGEDEEAPAPQVGEVVRSHGLMAQTITDVALVDKDGTRRLADIQLVQSARGSEDGLRDAAQQIAGIGSDGSYGNSVLLIMEGSDEIATSRAIGAEGSAEDPVRGLFTVDAWASKRAGETITIRRTGKHHWFNPNNSGWGYTNDFWLSDGTRAYCLSPTKHSTSGTFRVSNVYGSGSRLAKAAYYSPGAPGYARSKGLFTRGTPDAYATAHLILSYIYTGAWSGYEGSSRSYCISVMNSILALPDPPSGWSFAVVYTGNGTQTFGAGSMSPRGKFRVRKVSEDASVTVTGAYKAEYSLAGAKFTVTNSAGKVVATLTTGADGYTGYTPMLDAGTYTVKETANPENYRTASVQTANVNGQTEGFTMTIAEPYYRFGRAAVTKTDEGTGAVLTDAEFTLYEWDGKEYRRYAVIRDTEYTVYKNDGSEETVSTGKKGDGKYETGTLRETDSNKGRFKIAETHAPENHTIPDDWKKGKEFTLKSDNRTFLFTCEDPGYFSLSMVKKDENGDVLDKGDAVFRLYQMTKEGTYGDAGTLDWDAASKTYRKDGIKITKQNLGIFRVDEETEPAGYRGSTSIAFTVPGDIQTGSEIDLSGALWDRVKAESGGMIALAAENEEVEPVAQIRIAKTDAKTGKAIDESGAGTAVFRVYSYNTETRAYDKIAVDRMPYDGASHTYYTPVVWNDGTSGMEPSDGGHRAKSAALQYLKLDRDKKNPGYLNGGRYKVVEISAPDGYINDGYEEEIEIEWHDDPAEREDVQIFSLPTKSGTAGSTSASKAFRRADTEGILANQPNRFTIRKTDETGKALQGVYFFIGTSRAEGDFLPYYWKTEGRAVTKVSPEVINGTHLYKTDETGHIGLERLAAGTYYYQERVPLDGYAHDSDSYPYYSAAGQWHYFIVKDDGTVTRPDTDGADISGESETSTHVNHHAQPVNVTKAGFLADTSDGKDASKVSDASNEMNGSERQAFPYGTEFEIYEWDRDAASYRTEPYIRMYYDAAKGQFVDRKTGALPVVVYLPSNEGKFKIAETRQTNGYVLDAEPQEFTIQETPEENEKNIEITFKNEPNCFRIRKTAAKDGSPIEGVTFRVWKDSQGHLYQKDFTTGADGYTEWIYGLAPGVWKFQETEVPVGKNYDIDDSIHMFTVNDDGTIGTDAVQDDGTAAAVKAYTAQVDDTTTTTVVIKKKDARTGLEYDIDGSSFPDGTEFYIYEWDQSLNGGAGGYSETPKKHVVHATPTPTPAA